MATSGQLAVADNTEARRYEARAGAEVVGFIDYRLAPGEIRLLHTEVDQEVEGEGVGSLLVARALDDIRRRGLKVVPFCPFVAVFIKRHPEYSDLVTSR